MPSTSAREMGRRAGIRLAAALAMAFALPQASRAADPWPSKPVTLISAHAPGGAADQLSRLVAEGLQRELRQTVIVDNKPGASTALAAEYVARAPADGYTLLMATVTTLSINPSLRTKLRYDPLKDFAPVALVASTPFFVGINPKLPVSSMKDLVALAKAKPGTINYGSSGVGTSSHLAGALFTQMAAVDMVHVPYKATSTRNIDLAAGVIEVVFGNDVLPLAESGKLKVLAVTSAKRLSAYPDFPTVDEAAGLTGYDASVWYGLVAPAATPRAIVERLNAAVRKVLAEPAIRKTIATTLGGDPIDATPEQFAKTIRDDTAKWSAVVKRAAIPAED